MAEEEESPGSVTSSTSGPKFVLRIASREHLGTTEFPNISVSFAEVSQLSD